VIRGRRVVAILAVLAARGVEVREETRARILGCGEGAVLDRWSVGAATAASAEDVVGR